MALGGPADCNRQSRSKSAQRWRTDLFEHVVAVNRRLRNIRHYSEEREVICQRFLWGLFRPLRTLFFVVFQGAIADLYGETYKGRTRQRLSYEHRPGTYRKPNPECRSGTRSSFSHTSDRFLKTASSVDGGYTSTFQDLQPYLFS